MSAITVADLDGMSDAELYNTLKSHGFDVGPIVASTRGIYKKKLIENLKKQPSTTSPIPGLNSSNYDPSFRNEVLSHSVGKSSRSSVERPDSSNRYGDGNVSTHTTDRKSFSRFTTTSEAYDDQEGDDYELEEDEVERYERHSPLKLSQSHSSYSRKSYEPSDIGLGQSRATEYGRSIGDSSNTDYSDTRTGTVGSFRSSLGGLGSTAVGSSYRSSLGETASERADRILEDIRRRSALSTGYKPLSETDRLSRTRDILEQARQSGRVSKSQTYGTQKSVLSEYLLKIVIGLVLFACIYFIITSVTQPSALQAIDQEVSEILKDSNQADTE